jgi:hypothetical protein
MRNGSAVLLLALSAGLAQAAPLPRLRASENGRFFVKEGGSPFLYLADTAWGLYHFSREDADLYLKDRAAKRFTVIQTIVAHWGGLEVPNAYGQTVFTGGDVARPNNAYFEQVDYVVDKAASLGLYVAMVPIWSKEYVTREKSVLTKTSAFSYGKFLGLRYRDKPVIWILGGDWFADGVEDIWRAMAAGIAEGDGGNHLKTYHPKSPRSSSQWFHQDAWLDFNMIQSGHSVLNRGYELVAADWSLTPVKPVVEGESGYENIADSFGTGGYENIPGGLVPQKRIDANDVRRFAYCALFAGAAGYAYGCNEIFGIRGSRGTGGRARTGEAAMPWKEALQRPGALQMGHLRTLIESRPMLNRIPDQWLVLNDPLGTAERIEACRASDGSYAFIYTATGQKLVIRVVDRIYDKLSGKAVRAWWFDPRNGTSRRIGEFSKTPTAKETPWSGTFLSFTPPSSGPGNDWVLVLDDAARNFPAPGKEIE